MQVEDGADASKSLPGIHNQLPVNAHPNQAFECTTASKIDVNSWGNSGGNYGATNTESVHKQKLAATVQWPPPPPPR